MKKRILVASVALVGTFLYQKKTQTPISATLTEKTMISESTGLFKFSLPTKSTVSVPFHLLFIDESCQIARAYSPLVLSNNQCQVLIKRYPNGSLSSRIHDLSVGESIAVLGPFSTVQLPKAKSIGMIAGGTGITPFYQIIPFILQNESETKISLIFANQKESDILLKRELEEWKRQYPHRLDVFFTLDQPPSHWTMGKGWINSDMIKEWMPPPHSNPLILVCGPDAMMHHVSGIKPTEKDQGELGGLLKQLGYKKEHVLKFMNPFQEAAEEKRKRRRRRNKHPDDSDTEPSSGDDRTPQDPIEANKKQLEKLFSRIDRPIEFKNSKKKSIEPPPNFVLNTQGSVAGAGSGEFHIYRSLRRKEQERLEFMDEEMKMKILNEDFEQQRLEKQKAIDEKAAKRRQKRQKRRGNKV